MTKTQSNILEDVRSRLDEPTEEQFKDDELRRWANQGANDIARRTETLQATSTIPLVSGTQQYTAPTDTIRIYRVEYIDSSNASYVLEYRDFNSADSVWWGSQLTVQSTPMIWTAWGFPPSLKIVLYPIPDLSTSSIKVYYYKTPTELTLDGSSSNTTFDIPSGWEELIVDYVEYMALRKDRDPRWQESKSIYDEKVNAMYATTRRWTDQAGQFDPDVPMLLHPFLWNEDW